jgi:outer membrane protein assembly factor BamA
MRAGHRSRPFLADGKAILPGLALFFVLILARVSCGQAQPAVQGGSPLWVDQPLSRIEIVGLRRTKPEVVLREISLHPGQPIDWTHLEADRLRLLDLGIFAMVSFTGRRDPETNRPILVGDFKERPTLLILPVIEYEPATGFSYGVEGKETNLRGMDQEVGGKARVGGTYEYSVWHRTPWAAGRRLGLGLWGYRRLTFNEPESLQQKQVGGTFSLAPSRGPQIGFPMEFGVEAVRSRAAVKVNDDLVFLEEGRHRDDHRWIRLGARLDSRGYRLRPYRGDLLAFSVTQHGGLLGGDVAFERYQCDLLRVFPTGGESALTIATSLVLSRGGVPRYQRMTLGGTNTLRSAAEGEFRGESRWNAYLEQRVPLLPTRRVSPVKGHVTLDLTVDGTFFIDGGSIWEGRALEQGNARARWGVGGGLRVIAPLINSLSIDLATDGRHLTVSGGSGVRL